MDIYVINLAERQDRWTRIQELFKDFNLIRIDAVKHARGRIGCFLSHKKAIQLAKERGMKSICVIEDDCEPIQGIDLKQTLSVIKKYLDTHNDWNLFIGGGAYVTVKDIIRGPLPLELESERDSLPKLYVTQAISCLHFVIYHESSYDFFLQHPLNTAIDKAWCHKLQAIIPLPFIATQSDGFSNIDNKTVTVNKTIQQFETELIHDLTGPQDRRTEGPQDRRTAGP
jgi:hypothetical protein